jgi:signal transduction histidine kinase
MERVVANLISNAVKYSPQGGEVVVVADREDRDGELFAVLSVTDEGMGIRPDELERVFEPYFRGSNVARTVSGTGVGLAGVRHIVEQHGGTITIDSVLGKGTTFTVCLPVIRDSAAFVDI